MWPSRPAPLAGESLTSWLLRTAQGNGLDAEEFCHAVWPHANLLARDLDKFAPEFVVQTLAQATGTPWPQAWRTTLRSLEGVLFEEVPRVGASPWVLRAGVANRVRRRFGQQWCPLCLAEGPAYYRLTWRLALASTCGRHGVVLADRCHGCGTPANLLAGLDPYCHICAQDRRSHPTVLADSQALQMEDRLARLLDSEAEPSTALESYHTLAFYGTVHAVLAALVRGPRHRQLRAETAQRWGGDPTLATGQALAVEDYGVADRHRTMSLAARLLFGWPWRFVGICAEAKINRTHLFGFRRPRECPYPFVGPVKTYLTHAPTRTDPKQIHDCRELAYHGRPSPRAARRKARRLRTVAHTAGTSLGA
jgi:hypothetical protein